VRRQASAELRRDVRELVGRSGELLIALTGTIREAPGRTVADLLTHLRALSPELVRKRLLEEAMHGDGEAAPARKRLSRLPPPELKRLLEAVISRFYEEVFKEQEERLMAVIEADASVKRRLVGRAPAYHVIEEATNGIAYEQEPGITVAVLIPTVINRPWVTIAESGPEKYFYYPASEPSEPPERRLAVVFNALGDETRLRIVRRLALGPVALTELAEELGLAKSTVHQHMVVLRDARLVQTLAGAAKGYRLSRERPDLDELLRGYLSTGATARSTRRRPARPRRGSR
jgi:DNA-binding transcriptional ArsR family regulator